MGSGVSCFNSGIEPTQPETTDDLKNHLKQCMLDGRKVVFQVKNHKKLAKEFTKRGHKVNAINLTTVKPENLLQDLTDAGPSRSDDTDKALDDLRQKLQEKIGISPKLSIEDFKNWGKTQRAKVIYCHPQNKEEIQKVLKAVNDYKGKVKIRCAGARHSWSPLFPDSNNVLLYVDKIQSDYEDNSKIRISNRANNEVDIMTGVTTGDFKKFQLKNKINLDSNVILDAVQMVSVVATGCHGVGKGTKSPSDHVVKMRIFNSKGELKIYSKDKDAELFKAVAANFGCFGVIFDITIKLQPQMIVKTENTYHNLKNLFQNAENMKNMAENNWSVEMFWFPFNSISPGRGYDPSNDEVWVRQINEEKGNVDLKGYCYYKWKDILDCGTQDALALTCPLMASDPTLTPLFSFLVFETIRHVIYREGPIYQQLPHAVHFRNHIHAAPVYDMEFAFDIGHDYQKVLQIIDVVISKIDHSEEQREYPLNIALEMRFMGHSEANLCPANIGNPANGGTGQVLFIEVLSVIGTSGWEEFCKSIAEKWLDMGGVPHLAKQWSFIPDIERRINDKMGQSIRSFTEQLAKSDADPNGMFLNDALRKLLWATN